MQFILEITFLLEKAFGMSLSISPTTLKGNGLLRETSMKSLEVVRSWEAEILIALGPVVPKVFEPLQNGKLRL